MLLFITINCCAYITFTQPHVGEPLRPVSRAKEALIQTAGAHGCSPQTRPALGDAFPPPSCKDKRELSVPTRDSMGLYPDVPAVSPEKERERESAR